MNKKIIFYVIILIIIIVFGIFIGINFQKNNKTVATANDKENSVNSIQNNLNNINDVTNENNLIEASKSENENTSENLNNIELSSEESLNISDEDNITKAINIAKNNWGEDATVKFDYDGIDDNGNYIICIRDVSTTEALAFYYIDLESGSFTIE